MRYLPWFEAALASSEDDAVRLAVWLATDSAATRPLKAAFVADWPATPPTVREKAAQLGTLATAPLLPEWFRPHCPAAFESPELDVLHTRAPLWLRLQTDAPAEIFAEFSARGWSWRMSPEFPDAIELLTEADVTATDTFARGLFEVQDLGSQLILAHAAPPVGTRWLDACAGAGGKTLQLARLLGPGGHVTAHDIRPAALAELRQRAARAGLRNVSVTSAPTGEFDGVLVDAPCSGSGTWRRAPHLKWNTAESDVIAAAQLQRELLARYAAHVRPGGMLVYATCSLSRRENDDVAVAFLAAHTHFIPAVLARTIRPSAHNTDGFFAASFLRS